MDQLLLQRTRYVLRTRVRRVQSCPTPLFLAACKQLRLWISEHPVLNALVHSLGNVPGEYGQQIDRILREAPTVTGSFDQGFYSARTSEEHAALCLRIVSALADLDRIGEAHKREFVVRCLGGYLTDGNYFKVDDAIQVLRDVAVDGLYEYLDESLDARNVLYAVLLKYKQRSEWFRRERLRHVAHAGLEGRRGERALALDLYEYILDQGVEFFIEPWSGSGEADLVLRDSDGGYVIIDAKYLAEDATRSKIVQRITAGLNQVYRYCDDYGEAAGFLVVFNETPGKVRLGLPESDGLRFLVIGGRTVYYLAINLADRPSASLEGRAKEVVISARELIDQVDLPDLQTEEHAPGEVLGGDAGAHGNPPEALASAGDI